MTDWTSIEPGYVPVASLVYPAHDLDMAHLGTAAHDRDGEPIHVEHLEGDPGRYFVHDGRHRAIRAYRRGEVVISARVLTH